jgi:STE24 endopeptidase
LEFVLKLLLTLGGGIFAAQVLIARLALPGIWSDVAVIALVGVVVELIGLPFSIYRTFHIEARYGFNRTTPALYVLDLLKQTALAIVIGLPILAAVLALMRLAGPAWWLWAWLAWLAFSVLLSWAAPRFIAPFFNRFAPLENPELKERLNVLLDRCGFKAEGGLFVMNASLRSAHGNAYFTGIGRNKRIVFFDTLLAALSPPQVEAVLAHELGHFKLHHVRQRLLLSSVISLLGFILLAILLRQPYFYTAFHVQPSNAAALLLFFFVLPAFTYFLTPIASWWSRVHEFEADRFAARYADAEELAAALVNMYRDNASLLVPDPRYSAFYDSHPPALARIARLRALKI